MTSPLMTAHSQPSTSNVMMSYTSTPQFAGTKRPSPFSQSNQQPQHQHQHEYRQHDPTPLGMHSCHNGITQKFVNVATTVEQSPTTTSSITSSMENFNSNSNIIITAVNSDQIPYENSSKSGATSSKNANTKKTITTITPKSSTTPTTTVLTPLNREGKNLSEKKIRRLEKNRLSARNCRRKKKEVTQTLQKEINILEGENLRLRLQLKIGAEAEQSSRQEQDRVTEILDALLKSGASDSEIYANIEEFKEKFADYGRDSRSAIDFHLRNVKRLLMPTTTTSVALRALRWGSGGYVSGDGLNCVGVGGSGESCDNVNYRAAKSSSDIKLKEDDYSSEAIGGSKATTSEVRTMLNLKENIKAAVVKSNTELPHPTSTDNEALARASEIKKQQKFLSYNTRAISTPKEEDNTDTANNGMVDSSSSKQKLSSSLRTNTTTVSTHSFKDTAPLEPKDLFQYLVGYLEVTPAQATALKDSRHVSQELDEALATSLDMLEELRERLTRCGEDLDEEFSTIRSILTPRQAAKFLVWVANNEACMHMLNELWRKVYPEPIVRPTRTGGDVAEFTRESISDNFCGKESKKE